jgi:hypothetical protein
MSRFSSPALAVLAAAALAVPAVAAPARAAHPSFDGFWEHSNTSHLPRDPTPYQPGPAAQKRVEAERGQQGWVVGADSAYCLPAGLPFMMSGSEGFDLIQNNREIALTNEERPSPRHIYLDGRRHPDLDNFDGTAVGHSIGRWEGDTLVVDTVGFRPGSYSGLVHSDATHLTERYQLVDQGKHLKITFTWEDPKVLTKPWTYVYLMDRAAKDRYALEYYCDPHDPARTASNPGGKPPLP